MRNLSFQQIILLLAFILVPLINFIIQRVRRRLEHEIREEESVPQIRRQAKAIPTPALPPAPRASLDQARGSQGPTVSTRTATTSHITKRSLLGAQRDVQRGIIIMTVLGPCRAFDPPG